MKLIQTGKRHIKSSESRLRFSTTGGGSWKVWDRFIELDGHPLFHIGNVCGTCSFFFRRLRRAPSVELSDTVAALTAGLTDLPDALLARFDEILPAGDYRPCLFEVVPRLVGAGHDSSYFATDLREAWNSEPEGDVNTAFYQAVSRVIAENAKLFEFFVPLYEPPDPQAKRVAYFREQMRAGMRPTAVSVAVLDVKESMAWPELEGREIEPPHPVHWCFANYLLDGHHKMRAAAEESLPLTVLSYVALEPSWECVDELLGFYGARVPSGAR